jgi:uncharacterized ferritin-like protein (DUF455 family)
MIISEFAERLLVGDSLEDKLFRPSDLKDGPSSKPFHFSELPGRPKALAFRQNKDLHLLRRLKSLQGERERGQLLHFFANHEILAIELMALALLRFPDAPKEFRRKICKTIDDEQRHAKMYFERMKSCGVALGDVPLSSAFWDHLSGMRNLDEYMCGLALTLEQANLDFAHLYAQKFKEIGDEKTSKLLWMVYRDEIHHVKVGVEWMEARRGARSQWDYYCQYLLAPLSPSRAKNTPFVEGARLEAGLDHGFIENLKHYRRSKGRPPDVYLFNGLAELDHLNMGALSQRLLDMDDAMWPIMHLFCSQDDVLILRDEPSDEFRLHLEQSKRILPQHFVWREGPVELGHLHLGALKPWAWSSRLKPLLSQWLSIQTRGSVDSWKALNLEARARLSDKSVQRSLEHELRDIPGVGVPHHYILKDGSGDELGQAFQGYLSKDSHSSWWLKPCFGLSGRGAFAWDTSQVWPEKRVRKLAKLGGGVLMEERSDRLADYSLQAEFDGGKVSWKGVTRMLIDAKGQYLGAILSSLWDGLSAEQRMALHPNGEPIFKVLQNAFNDLLPKFFEEANYRGPFGVDAYLHQVSEKLAFRPCCELNPRFTFGRVALELEKRLLKNRVGLMFMAKQGCSMGPADMELEGEKWSRGAFALTDPWVKGHGETSHDDKGTFHWWCVVDSNVGACLERVSNSFSKDLAQGLRQILDTPTKVQNL